MAAIYKRALADLDGDESPLHFGPSHIVWEDENFDCAQWCLDHFDDIEYDFSGEDLAIVRRSLEELVALPEEDWDVMPEDYDGFHPENYPPTCEMERCA